MDGGGAALIQSRIWASVTDLSAVAIGAAGSGLAIVWARAGPARRPEARTAMAAWRYIMGDGLSGTGDTQASSCARNEAGMFQRRTSR